MHFIRKTLKRFYFCGRGIVYATLFDRSFGLQVFVGAPMVGLIIWLGWPLSELEWWLVGISYTLILITELQNSAFEATLDHVHPEQHPAIGFSKDMIAGSVLIAGLLALAVTIKIICF